MPPAPTGCRATRQKLSNGTEKPRCRAIQQRKPTSVTCISSATADSTKIQLEALSWYLKAAQQQWPDARISARVHVRSRPWDRERPAEAPRSFIAVPQTPAIPTPKTCSAYSMRPAAMACRKTTSKRSQWYRKAAEQGFAKAEKNLGDMYFFGRGVDRRLRAGVGVVQKSRRSAICRSPVPARLHVREGPWHPAKQSGCDCSL